MRSLFTTEFKVGLTVIISTLILIFGIIWGKEFQLKTNKYQMSLTFENVGGMVPGDPVMVNGVKEGKVLDIGWLDRQVLVKIELSNNVPLYEDATFTITSFELLAGMKIEVDPGKSDRKINLSQQPFEGNYGGQMVDVGLTISDLARDVNLLTLRLDTTIIMINQLLGSGTLQNDLSRTLTNLSEISSQMKTLPTDLNRSLSNLDNAVDDFSSLVKNNETGIHSTLQNINVITSRLDTVSISLKAVMGQIENQEGTFGKMIYDPSLYNNLSKALVTIDSLAQQIKEDGLDIDLF